MSPNNTNNNGGTRGRAALVSAVGTGAARADEMGVLARSFALIGAMIVLLVAKAPDIWPHLCAAQ